ncbi:MAG: energy-coupling factor transporter ATPase [Lachnospiraceae bacterium]|nr:energy-coupling factor transporter ATPase [Lachnospiraceae bacterium]
MKLEMKNVRFSFEKKDKKEQPLFDNLNVKIESGEFVGIVGETGAGKSTLMQLLGGIIEPDSGEVLCDDENIYSSSYDLVKYNCRVGKVFQYPEHQLFANSVMEDVCFGPINQGLSKEEAVEKAKKALIDVGVDEDNFSKSPFELSGGQKRRVAIAGVLAMEPEFLFLDEPTAGLDPAGRDEILDLISAMRKERKIAVVIISHSMEDMAKYVDRLIVMKSSNIVLDGDAKEILTRNDELEAAGLVSPQIYYIMKQLKEAGLPINEEIINVEDARKELLRVLS